MRAAPPVRGPTSSGPLAAADRRRPAAGVTCTGLASAVDKLFAVSVRRWVILWVVMVLAVQLLTMAASGPWDPWETHYGEVARQIVVRGDPLDLWWQPGNGGPDARDETGFWSKPALPFWAMALSFKVFGVGAGANPTEMVQPFWPALALRLPSMLVGLATAGFLGFVVARIHSARAGAWTALVLSTMPQFALASRQGITDTFLVGPVALALGAYALAFIQPERELRIAGSGWRRIPRDRAYYGFVVALAVAAIVPLAVLHEHVFDPRTVGLIKATVGGKTGRRLIRALPVVQKHLFIYWGLVVVAALASTRWRRRSQPLMGIVYLAAGLSLLGKGLIGPGIIGVVILGHIAIEGRWRILLQASLPVGIVLFVLASFPWHHAMWVFRGDSWVNEYIFMNNLMRFGTGEQKQAVGPFVYYLQTLGLAAFPWVAVVPVAIWRQVQSFRGGQREPRQELARYALIWFALSLWLMTFAATKYYHYVLPCLPPLAMVVGRWADGVAGGVHPRRDTAAVAVAMGLTILALVGREVLHEPAWLAHLTTYLYTGMWKKGAPDTWRLLAVGAPFALGMLLWLGRRGREALVAMALSGLLTLVYVIGDYVPAASESWSQRTAIRTYYRDRGPDDVLLSWWFYYRGETYFTKRDIWVQKNLNREQLGEIVAEREGKGAHLWIITTTSHGSRLANQLPPKYRDSLEQVYESFHYRMYRVEIP